MSALTDPATIAWLLRPDHRPEHEAIDEVTELFREWWALEGVGEYPSWLGQMGVPDSAWWEPVAGTPFRGVFGMTRILAYFLAKRPALRQWFDVSTQQGVLKANAWLIVRGLVEHDLLSKATPALRQQLLAPAPFLREFSGQPPVSWLMFFLWMCEADLQDRFDLREADGQRLFVDWFNTSGAAEHGLTPLLSVSLEVRNSVPKGLARGSVRRRPFGVNLVGYARGELGIGEDLRMAVAACEAAEIPYALVNLEPGRAASQGDRSLDRQLATSSRRGFAPFGTNVFCLTGFETARAYLEIGSKLFEGRYNIGWWPWELPVWPRPWRAVFKLVDEIWAASTFTEAMYREAVHASTSPLAMCPVHPMPLAVSVDRLRSVSRATLGLPEDVFLFLYIFDFNSYLARKNPFATIDAFRRAFPDDDTVGLVFKTMNSQAQDPVWRKFLAACQADKRIHLLDRTLERGEILGLVESCDAYVSLHRSEGFGRTLAEAMLLGKPVVGTDFSGNRDFLDADLGFPVRWRRRAVKPGEYPFVNAADRAWWAEPLTSDAARQMRATRRWRPENGQRVREAAATHFSPTRVGGLIRARLQELAGSA